MIKRAQIAAAAMALAIMMSQTAYAEILISPMDSQQVSQEKQEAMGGIQAGQNGQQTQNGQTGQVETGAQPGQNDSQMGTGIQPGQTSQPGTGIQPGQTGQPGQQNPAPQQSGIQAPQVELPAVPEISAPAGIVYDMTHDRVLFEKNADEKFYPASITKLMTALLVMEYADLNGTVTFSKTATTNLESGAVTLKLTEGDKVSVRDCLYGLLLKSANEVANGLAEHIGGSIGGFADLMNKKAAELGCTNTHFVNPNGLNDPNHYTTARDMVKIAKAAYANPTICEISSTMSYTFPATKNAAARTITPGHKMLYSDDSRYYPGIVAGKTGYTSLAGNTLVTCVEKNGVRLISVVLKAKSTQYDDTKALLDYGYALLTAEQGQAGQQNQNNQQGPDGQQSQNNQPGQNTQQSQPTGQNRWVQDGSIWRFEFADGSMAKNCLATIDGEQYFFNGEGTMMTGWQTISGEWYYFRESGAMAKNRWEQDAGKWFYLGADGRITRNAWIDNQYYVGADGIWVIDAGTNPGGAA